MFLEETFYNNQRNYGPSSHTRVAGWRGSGYRGWEITEETSTTRIQIADSHGGPMTRRESQLKTHDRAETHWMRMDKLADAWPAAAQTIGEVTVPTYM